ncbi:spinster family MFS transporter [Phenylobacterium sp.]|jgi:MFS family permease|uniref:spinster family MFS transporter n=1 Tax=Phenylobacterium sp. TaxID=1871053 RepID=UPI0037852F27
MSSTEAREDVPATPPPLEDGRRRRLLWLLLIVYTLNFLDRQVVGILAEPIKHDLGIADWQIGLMSGLAFAVFYTLLGLPIARLAETFNRVWIIGGSLTLWSAFTVACGFVQNFTQLVAARLGVGFGEAGFTPTSHSLIADYTPKEKRASALAFFAMGQPAGALIGIALGGIIADAYGWRTAFLMAGVPGLLLVPLVMLWLVEPRNMMPVKPKAPGSGHFWATVRHLMKKRTFRAVNIAGTIKSFISYGSAPFTASFFLRNHREALEAMAAPFGLGAVGFLGLVMGVSIGIAGMTASWLGGVLADRAARKDVRDSMNVPTIAAILSPFIYATALLIPNAPLALAILIIPYFLNAIYYGANYAALQGLAPPGMRTISASMYMFIINLIGLGLGPLLVGALSDIIAGPMGYGSAEGIRWALISTSSLSLVAAYFFWGARKTMREELVG